MTDDQDQPERSTQVMCERMADTVVDLFVDRLLEELKQVANGTLDRHGISELARTFKGEDKYKVVRRIQSIADSWLGTMEQDHWNQLRKRPFDRLLVKRFSPLFPNLVGGAGSCLGCLSLSRSWRAPSSSTSAVAPTGACSRITATNSTEPSTTSTRRPTI